MKINLFDVQTLKGSEIGGLRVAAEMIEELADRHDIQLVGLLEVLIEANNEIGKFYDNAYSEGYDDGRSEMSYEMDVECDQAYQSGYEEGYNDGISRKEEQYD